MSACRSYRVSVKKRGAANIVVVTCHDLGRHLGCYGVETVRSPNLDRLAQQGVGFSNCFCTAPQCSPSRASLFTGRYPHSNGVMGLTHGAFAWELNPDERHLVHYLHDHGRDTALCNIQHATSRSETLGFDAMLGSDRIVDCNTTVECAAQHLRDRPWGDSPFYLQVGFFEPHRPFGHFDTPADSALGVTVPDYLVDDDPARREFAAFQGAIYKLDAAVGRLLAELDDSGLAENTLFIFAADHGIPFPRAKCSLYDPGLTVALLMRWPSGGLSTGAWYPQLVSNVDVLPTILDFLDISVPERIQGTSLAPLLRGEPYEPRSEVFGEMTHHDYCDPRRCIRTETHKLIVNFTNAPFFMDPTQQWRPETTTRSPADPAGAYHEPVELYDLAEDPLEARNLASSAEHASVRRELLDRLHRSMRDTDDPLLTGIPLPPIYMKALQALASGESG